jgi:hypothetical protein
MRLMAQTFTPIYLWPATANTMAPTGPIGAAALETA